MAMRETLYAEIDLTDAVVALVKQGHLLGPTRPSNPKQGDYYLSHRRDKTA